MTEPLVSVVIATRDRPEKLARLLNVIKQQTLSAIEVIVVDDSSSEATLAAYPGIWSTLDARFALHKSTNVYQTSGGPGATRNRGIHLASGRYIAFCDDDDYWVKDDYLEVAVRAMDKHQGDVFIGNMETLSETVVVNPGLYSEFAHILTTAAPDSDGVYKNSAENIAKLLRHRILHCNSLMVRREMLSYAGVYWDKIRFAEDYNFALRLADHAKIALYWPTVVAILDVGPRISIEGTYLVQEKQLFSMMAALHGELVSTTPILCDAARRGRAWHMALLAEMVLKQGKGGLASRLARESLAIKLNSLGLRVIFAGMWQRLMHSFGRK
jgi:glycosyltransferase involved in cell wall biosynthesis